MRFKLPRPCLVMALFLAGVIGLPAQSTDVDQQLEEAKALYREAKFAQAIAKLQAVVTRLEQLRDLQVGKAQLADAYLHLALSYVALNDPAAARESLKAVVRLDRDRRLDPQVYAPKVIALFEEARAEVAREPAMTATETPRSPAAPASPAATAPKKGRSKTVPILLGAAGAAAAGVAVAAGGGSDAAPTSPPTMVPAPSATQTDLVLVGSSPPPGSTISATSGTLTLSLRYTMDRDSGCLSIGPATAANLYCARANLSLRRGSNVAVEAQVRFQATIPACAPPIDLPIVYAQMAESNCDLGPFLLEKRFDAGYRYVP